MEPIPESTQADDWFGPFLLGEEDLLPRMRELGRMLVSLVPACIGLSLSVIEHGVTFTVAASTPKVRMLDAVQYADDGPCMTAMRSANVLPWSSDDAERSWHAFALASAASGVCSTLSLPIVRDDHVVGGYNLYASTIHAFDDHHDEVATILGAWGGGATTNADLGFTSLDRARLAPVELRESTRLSVAVASLSRLVGCDHATAGDRIRRAAVQAEVPLETLVDGIIERMS